MWETLYAFGIGLAFSVGVGTGAYLIRMASKDDRTEDLEVWKKHREEVEIRLGKQVACAFAMADSLKKLADR